jgi:hypothetical protein
MKMKAKLLTIAGVAILSINAFSQSINFTRPADRTGINNFEATKVDTVPFDGLKVRVGGAFTQQFQMLDHSNTATPNNVTIGTVTRNTNALYPLAPGFNLATANLRFDVQLEDGIKLTLENYMSSRHHSEFWVKGGYIQIDKLPFLGNPEWFANHVSVKIGQFGINYGDQQFRRSDNGNTIYNPFVGNYIMDAFATEVAGEIYVYPVEGVFVMAGLTSGLLNGDVKEAYLPNGEVLKKNPSILAKAGIDQQVSDDLRLRLSASLYTNPGTTRNTLYSGDRAGSRYYMVGEPEFTVASGAFVASAPGARFTSGRISPEFSKKVTAITINPFVKFQGLEFFGTYEMAKGSEGSTMANPDPATRDFTQLAGELVYRFLPNEQAFVGARYNTVSGQLPGYTSDISVDRTALSLGWFPTKNLLVKLEYVDQKYNDFQATDVRNGLEFNGLMFEAAIGF